MEFKMRVTETLVKTVTINAEDIEDAEDIVRQKYDNQEIVLSSDDFLDVDFSEEVDDGC